MNTTAAKKNDNQWSFHYLPTLKIYPSTLVFYHQVITDKPKNKFVFSRGYEDRDSKKAYSGEMTQHSIRRLRRAIEMLFCISKFKWHYNRATGKNFPMRIALQTLTLSAEQGNFTDREIKKVLLEPYLRTMRGKGMKNYVWKAERQRNGNIHFHILTDAFVPAGEIRYTWNRLQAKLGLISKFYEKHGHYDPNSTDVKRVNTKKGMVNYMLKYMLKEVDKENSLEDDDPREIYNTGKTWDCSLNLKIPNTTEYHPTNKDLERIEKAVEEGSLKSFSHDFWRIFVIKNQRGVDAVPGELYRQFVEYVKLVRDT